MMREGAIPETILETPEADVGAPPGLGPLPGEVRYVRRGPHLGPPGHQLPPDERRALRATVAERRRRQHEAAEAARNMRVAERRDGRLGVGASGSAEMVTAARLSAESLAALGTPPRSPRSKLDDDGTSDAEQTPDVDDTELVCPDCEDQQRSHQVVSFRPDSLAVYQKTVEVDSSGGGGFIHRARGASHEAPGDEARRRHPGDDPGNA